MEQVHCLPLDDFPHALEQLKTVDKSRIDSYIGTLSDEEMKMIDKALRISLAIGRYKKRSV